MVKRAKWSEAEDDAFLRAWADVESQWSHKRSSSVKALFARFVELLGAHTTRTESTIGHRRNAYTHTHTLIVRFHSRSRTQPTDSKPDSVYSSDDYFELSRDEQRRWSATVAPGCHNILYTTRATFERVHAILAQTHQGSTPARQRSKAHEDEPQRKRLRLNAQPYTRRLVLDHWAEESDGSAASSTESEDDREELRWSPPYTSGNDAPSTAADKPHACDTAPSDPLDAAEDANTDLLHLIDELRDRAARVCAMVAHVEHERKRDVRVRQRAAETMRASRDRVLMHVQRCERLLDGAIER